MNFKSSYPWAKKPLIFNKSYLASTSEWTHGCVFNPWTFNLGASNRATEYMDLPHSLNYLSYDRRLYWICSICNFEAIEYNFTTYTRYNSVRCLTAFHNFLFTRYPVRFGKVHYWVSNTTAVHYVLLLENCCRYLSVLNFLWRLPNVDLAFFNSNQSSEGIKLFRFTVNCASTLNSEKLI